MISTCTVVDKPTVILDGYASRKSGRQYFVGPEETLPRTMGPAPRPKLGRESSENRPVAYEKAVIF
jgi:hypothetical protein